MENKYAVIIHYQNYNQWHAIWSDLAKLFNLLFKEGIVLVDCVSHLGIYMSWRQNTNILKSDTDTCGQIQANNILFLVHSMG